MPGLEPGTSQLSMLSECAYHMRYISADPSAHTHSISRPGPSGSYNLKNTCLSSSCKCSDSSDSWLILIWTCSTGGEIVPRIKRPSRASKKYHLWAIGSASFQNTFKPKMCYKILLGLSQWIHRWGLMKSFEDFGSISITAFSATWILKTRNCPSCLLEETSFLSELIKVESEISVPVFNPSSTLILII